MFLLQRVDSSVQTSAARLHAPEGRGEGSQSHSDSVGASEGRKLQIHVVETLPTKLFGLLSLFSSVPSWDSPLQSFSLTVSFWKFPRLPTDEENLTKHTQLHIVKDRTLWLQSVAAVSWCWALGLPIGAGNDTGGGCQGPSKELGSSSWRGLVSCGLMEVIIGSKWGWPREPQVQELEALWEMGWGLRTWRGILCSSPQEGREIEPKLTS